MKQFALLALLVSPLVLCGQTVFINETFDTDSIGLAPNDPAQKHSAQVLVQSGSGAIGTDNVAHFNDATSSAGALEYNVGDSGLSSLYASFDLLNAAHSGTGPGSQPIIFGIGEWNSTSGSAVLNANAKRYFNLEFSALGTTSTLKIRIGGTTTYTATYDPSELQHVQIWLNDHNTNSLSYTRPDNYATAMLDPNSVVIFINGVLIGSTDSGIGIQTSVGGNGDSTIGRVGFYSSQSDMPNFYIDNLYVAAIPEPSTYAAIVGVLALGVAAYRRRQRVCSSE